MFLLVLGALEGFSLLGLYLSNGIPEHSYRIAYRQASLPQQAAGIAEAKQNFPVQANLIPHPYFGAIPLESRLSHPVFSENSLPQKNVRSVNLGILGASVATQLAQTIEAHPDLKQKLLRLFHPSAEELKVHVLTVPSGKQPQQFSIAVHSAELIDFTINIDGYMELFANRGRSNEFRAEYPMGAEILFPKKRISKPEMVFKSHLMNYCRQSLGELALSVPGLRYSNTYYFFFRQLELLIAKRLHAYWQAEESPPTTNTKPERDRRIDVWSRFTQYQFQFLQAQSIPSFYFLPPLPEAMGRTYKKFLGSDIQDLSAEAVRLQTKGLPVFDLSQLLRRQEKDAFIDEDAHLSEHARLQTVRAMIQLLEDHLAQNKWSHICESRRQGCLQKLAQTL